MMIRKLPLFVCAGAALWMSATTASAQFPGRPGGSGTGPISVGGGPPATDMWIDRLDMNVSGEGRDSWRLIVLLNEDRREAQSFDNSSQSLRIDVGSQTIELLAGTMTSRRGTIDYSGDMGGRQVRVRYHGRSDRLDVDVRRTTINDKLPDRVTVRVTIGDRVREVSLDVDASGRPVGTHRIHDVMFLVDRAKLRANRANERLDLGGYFHDPDFLFNANRDDFVLRLYSDENMVFERNLGSSLASFIVRDRNGVLAPHVSGGREAQGPNSLVRFNYDGSTGVWRAVFDNTDFTGVGLSGATHLTLELQVGRRTYTTDFTIFESRRSRFSVAN